jgi:hypothetical protein
MGTHPIVRRSRSLLQALSFVLVFCVVLLAFLNWPANRGWIVRAQAAQHGIKISWTAVTMDVNGNPITGVAYNLYRGTSSGAEGATPYITGITATTYTDTNGVAATTYFYQVTTTATGKGESVKSAEVSAAFPLIQALPPAGVGAVAQP